jgi:heme oxygenase
MSEALELYLARLSNLSQVSPALLLAHIYVRILGDLSGGQYIGWQLKKVYQLEEESLSFYRFGQTHEDVIKTKHWFKCTMNESVPLQDIELKGKASEATL